jgi:hypothetical protein
MAFLHNSFIVPVMDIKTQSALLKILKEKLLGVLQIYAGKRIRLDNIKQIKRKDLLFSLWIINRFTLCSKNNMQYNATSLAVLFLGEGLQFGYMTRQIQIAHIGIYCRQLTIRRVENGTNKHLSSLSEPKCTKSLHLFNGKSFKSFTNDTLNW